MNSEGAGTAKGAEEERTAAAAIGRAATGRAEFLTKSEGEVKGVKFSNLSIIVPSISALSSNFFKLSGAVKRSCLLIFCVLSKTMLLFQMISNLPFNRFGTSGFIAISRTGSPFKAVETLTKGKRVIAEIAKKSCGD